MRKRKQAKETRKMSVHEVLERLRCMRGHERVSRRVFTVCLRETGNHKDDSSS